MAESNKIDSFKLTFLDEPFASEFFLQTIENLRIPVIQTPKSLEVGKGRNLLYLSGEKITEVVEHHEGALIYTHSENSIEWIENYLGKTKFYSSIQYFKNKVLFRNLLREIYPEFFFTTVRLDEIESIDISMLPMPFIVKPAVGFLSLGVMRINSESDWNRSKKQVLKDCIAVKNFFPSCVVDSSTLIIEEYISGEEYASDCYFDQEGNPVVLSVFKHVFASGDDVSDRVYTTSAEIVKSTLPHIESFLQNLGKKTGLKNFPLHIEIRVSEENEIMPIEVNPVRFGGWCTTADMSFYSYGFNPYEYFFSCTKPDWPEIFRRDKGFLYSIIVLDNRTGISGGKIRSFNYKKLTREFEYLLEVREVDFSKHPVFGFMFVRTREDNFDEIIRILQSDLMDYITI